MRFSQAVLKVTISCVCVRSVRWERDDSLCKAIYEIHISDFYTNFDSC